MSVSHRHWIANMPKQESAPPHHLLFQTPDKLHQALFSTPSPSSAMLQYSEYQAGIAHKEKSTVACAKDCEGHRAHSVPADIHFAQQDLTPMVTEPASDAPTASSAVRGSIDKLIKGQVDTGRPFGISLEHAAC